MEPWDHIKDCDAAITYVTEHPKLWYLLEPDLSTSAALTARGKESLLLSPAPPTSRLPLTRARAQAIAQAVTVIHKLALYDPLGMPSTEAMEDGLANAAGDMDDDGNELKYRKCIIGPDKEQWIQASITEFHRLFRTYNTIRMITYDNISEEKKPFISYYNPQCKTKMKPDGKHYRVRGTFGGNRTSSYNGVTASYQAAMSTVKLLLNKNISHDGSRWMTMDVTDMYLHSRLPDDQYEYMVLNLDEIPQEIIDEYNIQDYISPGDTKAYWRIVRNEASRLSCQQRYCHSPR
jgi:hypothetical protein